MFYTVPSCGEGGLNCSTLVQQHRARHLCLTAFDQIYHRKEPVAQMSNCVVRRPRSGYLSGDGALFAKALDHASENQMLGRALHRHVRLLDGERRGFGKPGIAGQVESPCVPGVGKVRLAG